jgi:peptidoglycan/xylan/chitin deacetylase (PgdA/CDA1 family)
VRIAGAKTVRQAVRWLSSRFVRGALVLGYHRVATAQHDPYSTLVSPQHFAEQLEVLRDSTHPLALQQAIEQLQAGNLPPRAVVVTFDDGYADLLAVALPLLNRFAIPATVFITSGYLGREFWWDQLTHLVKWPLVEPPHYAGVRVRKQPIRRHRDLYQYLLTLPSTKRDELLANWITSTESGYWSHNGGRCLSREEVLQLARSSLIDIGAHSLTHPILATLPAVEQRLEIVQSKQSLEELLQRPLYAFSYPHGSGLPLTQALVQEAGFRNACSSVPAVAHSASPVILLHCRVFGCPTVTVRPFGAG